MSPNSHGVTDTATDASRIRALLQAIGISQREAARRLGIDDRSMRYYCSGKLSVPSAIMLALQNVDAIVRNEQGLALLANGTMSTSDGSATAADLSRKNEKLGEAIDLLMRPVRSSSMEADEGCGEKSVHVKDICPKHAPTLHLHATQVLLLAFRARNRAIKEYADRAQREDTTSILTPDSNVAIVLAAASTEAFVNELAEYVGLSRQNASEWRHLPQAVLAAADEVFAAEDARERVTDKYVFAAGALSKPFDKGALLFQDFVRLVALRNAIMHIKPARLDIEHSGEQVAEQLATRGLAKKRAETFGLPWFDRLQTPGVARWACESGRNIILAMLERIAIPAGVWDPFEFFRSQFRDHVGFQSENWL
jgi:transcriptional regulator with XRE-family HTH domain